MVKYTSEDLLLYMYGETSPQQALDIEEALDEDWDLKEQYDGLKHTLDTLDKMVVSPREESVNAILKYAGITSGVEQS